MKLFRACDCYHFPCKHNPAEKAVDVDWKKWNRMHSRFEFIFAWYDLWIGVFYDQKKRWIYIFPAPCFGVIVKLDAEIGRGSK